jgi:4-hydroxybenzoate polyprenyltransferase
LRQLFTAIIDLLLYSNLWIAMAAVAMAAQTQLLLSGRVQPTPLLGFILFATLFLYAIHRIVGLRRSKPFLQEGRYQVISRFRSHIVFYALVAGLCALLFYLQLPFRLMMAAVAPCLLALAYVLPVWKGKRLRDVHYVKIFLIAIAWSWITVFLPALELGMSYALPLYVMVLERLAFVFAITIPFDIRDLEIDAYNRVKTLPASLGVRKSQRLAAAALLLMCLLAALNYYWDVYSASNFAALSGSALIAAVLVYLSEQVRHDYFFTGLVDGLMLVQFGLVYAFC